jgi:CheY-like chemotaxis protein
MLQGYRHTVLLIEADSSLRRLIALGLQYRGMHVIETGSPMDLPVLELRQPSLVVLDIDGEARSNRSLLSTVMQHPYLSTLPMVVLAWDCLVPADTHQAQVTCLSKPFDARTLQATIEQILRATGEISSTPKQEVLLAAHSASPAPSIWPLITAVGLLLAFIGLMTQFVISVLGLLIIIVSLLLWTLGTKPEHEPLAVKIG